MAAAPEAFLVPPPPPPPPAAPQRPPETPRPRNGLRAAGGGGGKRRSSCGAKQPAWKRRRRAASECGPVLPSEFLLGGNIFDPLNLNSLLDEEVSRALNARTPQSSPLPARGRDPVEILVPRDITDPLSLNAPGDDGPEVRLASPAKSGRRRHRHRGQQRANSARNSASSTGNNGGGAGSNVGGAGNNAGGNGPEEPPEPGPTGRHRKRRRTCSKSEGPRPPPPPPAQNHEKPPQEKPQEKAGKPPGKAPRRQERKFQYGNYCKYYGYRNPDVEDSRLRALRPEWFAGKEVLDVGCNVGHLTLSIAKRWGPSRVVGLDIDGRLVRSARQNIRHYLSEGLGEGQGGERRGFPAALLASRGPIAAPQLPPDGPGAAEFPHNVVFVTGNYVPEREELVQAQRPEFDVVLLLSLTKWVQLNWGDEGLKRLFRRAFRHLRPGGLLVLEPQPWGSYRKRKGLTETTFRNYQRIRLRPEQFPAYLTSPEVGFERCELLGTPQHSSKGFQRPIYLFHKGQGDAP
ncbi:LOW QUALITY PROTEIN: 7SK snRNA methylphosphate capping enzyme [Corapipo altera]|uniref:LOW QUALITY PROTEIN: 7SK snRNA methylphosphate capping enzyme n=1 Tax=Corapipo altera TaxID=415028 RepID=UPI000FD678BB|nr:LOW QUALITY PROTEIN: 7SK snRNA methylphosphate capping enzyme [Corapipo altera]